MSSAFRALIAHDALPSATLGLLTKSLHEAGFTRIDVVRELPQVPQGPEFWLMADRIGRASAFDVVRRINRHEMPWNHPVATGVVLGLGYRPMVLEHFGEDRPDLFIIDAPMLDANLWEASIASTTMPQAVRLAFCRLHRAMESWMPE